MLSVNIIHGFVNIPRGEGPFPVVIALHGYIPADEYTTLDYSTRYADSIARKGYIVLHPNLRNFPPSTIVGRVRGRIVLHPEALFGTPFQLDRAGRHHWQPFAPIARIEVDIAPGHRWQGHGYFDANYGTAALEADFNYWTWGRFPTAGGATCFYDAELRDGTPRAQALRFSADGRTEEIDAPPRAATSNK